MKNNVGRKVRLGQLKSKRQDKEVDRSFLNLLVELKLVGHFPFVKSEIGIYADLKNLPQKQQKQLFSKAFDYNFIVKMKNDFYHFILLS